MQDDVKSDANKELNLCEILRGHEGENFFSPCYGNVTLSEVQDDRITITADVNGKKHSLRPDGTHISGAVLSCVNLLPSVGLYQQYPLDPYTAWQKWLEEQKKYSLAISWQKYDNRTPSGGVDLPSIRFRNPSDRDKCIEEIKSVIQKYSK